MATISVRKVSGEDDLREVHHIRRAVFVDEQHCPPELEYSNEEVSTHFLADIDGQSCGAARWRTTGSGFKLERFAVLRDYRGKGVGQALLFAILDDLPKGNAMIYLNAQVDATPFYEQFHFVAVGEIFEEAGIRHQRMLLPRIAFVTCAEYPEITPDDKILSQWLAGNHIRVTPAVWSDPNVNWKAFELIVIRSTWDYYRKPKQFDEWLTMMARENLPLVNPVAVIQWNKDKIYLKELAEKGVHIPHFCYCEQNGNYDLTDVLDGMSGGKAVIKPSMSGGAYNTFVASQPVSVAEDEKFKQMLLEGAVIVQEYVEEVTANGEMSLIFFDREFSHAVRKATVPGDFRVQPKFGGAVRSIEVPQQLVDMSIELLNMVPADLFYARVDVLRLSNGHFTLMELELIEPILFIRYDHGSPERFIQALMRMARKMNK